MITPTPDVIIDACVPRTPRARCDVLFEYLVDISQVGPHSALDPIMVDGPMTNPEDHDPWSFHEDNIISAINGQLPDDLVCTMGEFNSGDVLIREMGSEEEDMAALLRNITGGTT